MFVNPVYPESIQNLTVQNSTNIIQEREVQNFENFYFGTTYYTGEGAKSNAHQVRYFNRKDPATTVREISEEYHNKVTGTIPYKKAGIVIVIDIFSDFFSKLL